MNRVFQRRGPVLDGRYHHRLLRTPREVRYGLAYVLLNARHHFYERHGRPPPTVEPDAASSAQWFEGWKHPPPIVPLPLSRRSAPHKKVVEVAPPGTWLLRKGWRRHRLIDPTEIPGH